MLHFIESESWEIEKDFAAAANREPAAGDSERNNPVRGFISFDISGLPGIIVMNTRFDLSNPLINGDPGAVINRIRVESVQWGERPIILDDFGIPSTLISLEYGPTVKCLSTGLIDELQKALDNGRTRSR